MTISSSDSATNPSSDLLPKPAPRYDPTMIRAMARNVAGWTDASVRALGIETHATDALWWREAGGSGIYLGAVILDAATPDAQLVAQLRMVLDRWGDRPFALYDTWASRDLGALGLRKGWQTPWYLRPAGLGNGQIGKAAQAPELIIEKVETAQQLAEFEIATRLGFEDERLAVPFSQHGLATLAVPDMLYLNGRLIEPHSEPDSAPGAGQVVSSVIAHSTDSPTDNPTGNPMIGILGLSTLPAFRRRGYARAMVRAVVDLYPDLAINVYPDPETAPIYTQLGFIPGGQIAFWHSG